MKKKIYIKPETEIMYVKLEPLLTLTYVVTGSIGVDGTATESGDIYTGGITEGEGNSWSTDGLTTSKRGVFLYEDDEW